MPGQVARLGVETMSRTDAHPPASPLVEHQRREAAARHEQEQRAAQWRHDGIELAERWESVIGHNPWKGVALVGVNERTRAAREDDYWQVWSVRFLRLGETLVRLNFEGRLQELTPVEGQDAASLAAVDVRDLLAVACAASRFCGECRVNVRLRRHFACEVQKVRNEWNVEHLGMEDCPPDAGSLGAAYQLRLAMRQARDLAQALYARTQPETSTADDERVAPPRQTVNPEKATLVNEPVPSIGSTLPGATPPIKPIPLDKIDLQILRAMEGAPAVKMQQDIATAAGVGRKCVGERLNKRLIPAGLAAQPEGRRTGYILTTAGQERCARDVQK
jgi:hypothetical protein